MRFCRAIFTVSAYALSTVALLAFIFALYLGYNYFSSNIHTVIAGKIYRSAQFDHHQLKKYTQQFHLKTIINLRGAWPSNHWYQVEHAFAQKNHLHYYPILFSSYTLPPKNQLRALVHLLQTVPKPLIFHCEGGADRTGMAAAISIILFAKNPSMHLIKKQASWHYNAISRHTVGYQVLRNYFSWLKKNKYHYSSAQRFLSWVHSPVKMRPYSGWFLV